VTPCRHLRWKGFHGVARTPLGPLWQHPSTHHSPCTCLTTGQPWGPDAAAATVKTCRAARGCYEAPPVPPGIRGWLARLVRLVTSS